MPADAIAVHGLTAAFLADKPLFGAVADEPLAFVGDAPLVAHNAGFDIAFLNAELKRAAKPPIATDRVVDTLVLARAAALADLDTAVTENVVGGGEVKVKVREREVVEVVRTFHVAFVVRAEREGDFAIGGRVNFLGV